MNSLRGRAGSFTWNSFLLLAVVFAGYLVFGLSENIKGPAIPRMQADLRISEFQVGLLLAFNSLGYLIACSFTGLLVRKLGMRATTVASFGAMAVSGLFIWASSGFFSLSAAYFFLYIGNGALEIVLSLLGARIFTRNAGTMMNLAHFFYGLSSMAAPLAAAYLMAFRPGDGGPLGWGGMYALVMALSILPAIPALLARFPGKENPEDPASAGKQEAEPDGPAAAGGLSVRQYARDPVAWFVVAILSAGVVAEMAFGGWLPAFLEKAYRWDGTAASAMLSGFFVCFTAARLVLGPLTDRIGLIRSILIFSLFSGLCTVAAVFAGEPGAWLFALAGAGIAPIYPTVMAFLAVRYAGRSDAAITFTVTMLGFASVAGNLLIGAITDGFGRLFGSSGSGEMRGMQAGFLFIGLCALLCALAAALLLRHLKNRKAAPARSGF